MICTNVLLKLGDIFLTHDSPSVRKSHNEGWKHQSAVRNYYSQFEENKTQSLIDQKVKQFEQLQNGARKYSMNGMMYLFVNEFHVPLAMPPWGYMPPGYPAPMGAPGMPPEQYYQPQPQPHSHGHPHSQHQHHYQQHQQGNYRGNDRRNDRNERNDRDNYQGQRHNSGQHHGGYNRHNQDDRDRQHGGQQYSSRQHYRQ